VTSASYYGPPGPYGTESEAITASGLPDLEPGKYYNHNLSRLTAAASAAGVQLGSYDTRILTWLADREPQVVEAIAALIDRAAQQPGPQGR
jgi:hypothetical protein